MVIDKEETNIASHVILVTKDNKIILQKVDSKPGLINPGKISMYGGTIKANEKSLEGLYRELEEELNFDFRNFPIEKLGTYHKTKETDGVDYIIHVFVIKRVDPNKLESKEGLGLVIEEPNKALNNPKLTRITKLALEDFIKKFKAQ